MNPTELWEKTLTHLKSEVSEAAFKTWFSKTSLIATDEGTYEVVCANAFAKTKVDSIYKMKILERLSSLVGSEIQLNITFQKDYFKTSSDRITEEGPLIKTIEEKKAASPIKTTNRSQYIANLSPHYTLENFIVGPNNRLSYAMASAVASAPGANANNPFFLHASVGLGKTHLVQAIGNDVIQNYPSLRVLYTTSENFTNELIGAIQHRTQNNFRKKFRDVDVLIIDDIQFMAGRESTQEEFFHTFNALYLSQKQIILTSDRHPREITRLEERLTSRFGGGIMADIQSPDFETRLAILQAKTQNLNLKIAPEILNVVASNIQTNIRELEGGLKQVVNLMLSQNGELSLEEVQALFENRYSQNSKMIDPLKVVRGVCDYFGIRESDIVSPRRTQTLVRPRQIAMYLLRTESKLPLMRVGELLGGKDHTTIIHGVNKIEKELKGNPLIREEIEKIKRKLNALP